MYRFFLALFLLISTPALSASFVNNPPLKGSMRSLKVFSEPVELEMNVMVSSADKGLTYFSEFRDKVTLINLWATWCSPCIEELPSLNALQYAMDKNKFQIATISLDNSDLKTVKDYLVDHSLQQLPAYVDANNMVKMMPVLNGVPGIPVTLIVDPQLRVLAMFQGDTDWNGPDARAVLDYYLKNVTYGPDLNLI